MGTQANSPTPLPVAGRGAELNRLRPPGKGLYSGRKEKSPGPHPEVGGGSRSATHDDVSNVTSSRRSKRQCWAPLAAVRIALKVRSCLRFASHGE